MKKFHYVYVLLSLKDRGFYIGYTQDLKLRFERHCQGRVESTIKRRLLELIYYESCLSKKDALRREKYFKTYLGRFFLKKRLKSYLTGC